MKRFNKYFSADDTAAGSGITHSAPADALPSSFSAEEILQRDYAGSRILLAEDMMVNREVALAMLEFIGLIVDIAEDGVAAVKLASSNDYALILMDMHMPNMDGLQATRQIRSLPNQKTVPIVAMTGNSFEDDGPKCTEAGMNDFISKPFEMELLYSTLLKWMSQSRS